MLAAATAFGTLRRRQLASGSLPLASHTAMIGGTAPFALFALTLISRTQLD